MVKQGPTPTMSILVMRMAESLLGLEAEAIQRVFAAAEVTPLPGAPTVVAGVINVHGQVVPVLDLRRRLGLGPSTPSLSDRLVVVANDGRPVALLVEAVEGIQELPRQALATMKGLLPGTGFIKGVLPTQEGLILIQDVGAFLTASEEETLTAAMSGLAA